MDLFPWLEVARVWDYLVRSDALRFRLSCRSVPALPLPPLPPPPVITDSVARLLATLHRLQPQPVYENSGSSDTDASSRSPSSYSCSWFLDDEDSDEVY